MRAVLILVVLSAWIACLVVGAACTAFLVFAAVRPRWRPPSVPRAAATALVCALAVFAVAMAAVAVAFFAVEMSSDRASLSSAFSWAALPAWSAATSTASAVVLARRSGRITSMAEVP